MNSRQLGASWSRRHPKTEVPPAVAAKNQKAVEACTRMARGPAKSCTCALVSVEVWKLIKTWHEN
jgi:hypothetical protein